MKNKYIAAVLAATLGAFGIHKFYLRQPEAGIVYIFLYIALGRILFFPLSTILGWFDAYKLLTMDPNDFDRKYNSYYFRDRYGRRLERAKEKENRRGKYILMDEDAQTTTKNKEGFFDIIKSKRQSETLKQSGIKKFKDYDISEALLDFTKALEINPNDLALHFNIACCYSLIENKEKAFYHLERAVALGFNDFSTIKSHESLAYLRIQNEFEQFVKNNYRLQSSQQSKSGSAETTQVPIERKSQEQVNPQILEHLQKLKELRDRGIINQEVYAREAQKLQNQR